MNRTEIVRALADGNLFQPATVLWRVFEIEAVHRFAPMEGLVLDLGCGDGSLSRVVFDGAPVTLVGVDPDVTDARAARASGRYERVHATAGDSIPEPDDAFDVVFSNSVLEHIPAIEPVLAESSRILRDGGRFIFTVPSEGFHDCLDLTWLSRIARRRGETEADAIDRRLAHHRYWSPDEWKAALHDTGLKVVDQRRYLPRSVVRRWQRLSNATGGLVFELFRMTPRTAFHRFRLPAVERLLPPRLVSGALGRMLRGGLAENPDPGDGPSGGLLIVAEKVPS